MDDTARKLLDEIRSWLEEKENCAKNLWKLVKELEDLRENCNAGECVGNAISFVGAACLVGSAVATFCTAGAAAPILSVLGAAYVGTGGTISVSSKLIEHFVSSSTMEDANKAAKKSEIIEEEIMELIGMLKMERVNTKQDESEYIASRIFEAMSGTGHSRWPPNDFIKGASILMVLLETFQILSIKKQGQITKKVMTTIVQELAVAGGKSAAKACSMAVAGGIGMVFALTESIDSWKELVTKKHVTEASQSLRDTAENIDRFCKDLRNNLKRIQEAIEQTKQQTTQQTNNNKGNQSNQNQSTNNHQGNQSNQNQSTNNHQGNQSHQKQSTNNNHGKNKNQNQQTNSNPGDDDDEDKQQNNRGHSDIQLTDNDEESDSVEERDSDEEGYLGMGLLNVRSMTLKAYMVSELIEQYNLDIFLTTETWLRPFNFRTVLRNACPPNFVFHHQARQGGRRGGGVAIQHRNAYIGQEIRFPFFTPFEYVAVVLENDQWEVPVLLFNMYFPPGYTRREFHRFVFDFNMLLDDLTAGGYNHVVFTGDFNIHMDDGMQSSANEFHMLLHVRGLELHVNQPTHIRGHTLDLVFTWNVDISNVRYLDFEYSDHLIILFRAIPVSPYKKKKEKKKKRKVKNMSWYFKFN